MDKLLPLLVAASATAVACSFAGSAKDSGAAPSANRGVSPEVERRLQAVRVDRVYAENCAKCHGDVGQGGGGGTRTLLTRELFEQKHDKPFFDAIKNGVPHMGMEAYGETLSDPEIWGLVVYIRELQGRALRAEFGSPKPNASGVFKGQRQDYRVETVVSEGQGLRTPWGVDWLPDGRFLVTNRPGSMHLVKDGKVGPAIEGTPRVIELGQGGLMDVAVHPDYAQNGWIYLAFTDPGAEGGRTGQTKIVRGKLQFSGDGARWTDQQTIFQAPAESYTGAGVHFGSRIVFDGKGHVFFAIGERGGMIASQDPKTSVGKIFRVNEDGTLPKDNPFAGQPGVAGAVWSVGHRNPQGLVMDLNGGLWDTEHGPRGGDEVNLIQKGANYGWPTHAFSINYNGAPLATPWPKQGENIALPAFRWMPSIGASGLDVVRGNAFPQWRGDLVAGGLSGQNVDRIRVSGGSLVEREELIHGMGRVRDVATAPDGTIYVVLNGPDKIIRLVPAG